MSEEKTDTAKVADIEEFYKNAFIGKSAKLLSVTSGFRIEGVVEIDTGDERGIVYLGTLRKIIKNPH